MGFEDTHLPDSLPRFDPDLPIANIGVGVMGTKVAWACARAGLCTRIVDTDTEKLRVARETAISWSTGEEQEIVADRLQIFSSLDQAIEGVQLVFENVPEQMDLKSNLLEKIGRIADPSTYIGSNTSSFLCTPLATACGRPSQFFNLNFTDPRHSKLVELMTCDLTASETVQFVKQWVQRISMVPIWTPKEQMGYSFNRLWRVIKKEVLRQVDQGYTTPLEIDRAWMLIFGTDIGPCGLMDEIGLHTVASVEESYYKVSNDESDLPPGALMKLVEQGFIGEVSGRGFYSYPNPEYRSKSFLQQVELTPGTDGE